MLSLFSGAGRGGCGVGGGGVGEGCILEHARVLTFTKLLPFLIINSVMQDSK